MTHCDEIEGNERFFCSVTSVINTDALPAARDLPKPDREEVFCVEAADINEIFENAVDEYSDMVTRICMLSLGNMIDAQDAYLAAFEKLFIALKKGKTIDDIKKWLAKVAYNECKSMMRLFLRHKQVNMPDVTEPFEKQQEIELAEMLFSLPEKHRNLLYLYYNEGYTTKEIASITGQREGTVRSNLKRARDKLREVCAEYERKGELSDEEKP